MRNILVWLTVASALLGAFVSDAGAKPAKGFKWRLTHQQVVVVSLDRCAGGFGTVSCNHDYKLSYPWGGPTILGFWCDRMTGLKADTGGIVTVGGYCNSNPETIETISLWGRRMTYDAQGRVFDRPDGDGRLVGHLK